MRWLLSFFSFYRLENRVIEVKMPEVTEQVGGCLGI